MNNNKTAENILNIIQITIKKIVLISWMLFAIIFKSLTMIYDKITLYSNERKYIIEEKINDNITTIKKVVGITLISYELYSIIAQPIIISLWISANFIGTILFIYHNLSNSNINKRIVKIGLKEIQLFFGAIFCCGGFILFLFNQDIGIILSLFMFYLMNRSYQIVY